jgi:hypothetical protein
VWLCLLLGLPSWAQSSGDEIELGAKFKLGMPQQQVLTEVGKHFELKSLSDSSHYVVFQKPKENEKPQWEGMLSFKAGKLAAVERLWAYQNDESGVAITKSLVGVLNSLVKDGHSTCVVQSVVSDAPDAQAETIFLNCGKRSLKISVAKIDGYKEDASISEILDSD